jgi:hypothetical protein
VDHSPPPIEYWLHCLGITGALLVHLIIAISVALIFTLIIVAWLGYLFIKFSSEYLRLSFELLKTIVDALLKEVGGRISEPQIKIERLLLILFILAFLICGIFWGVFAHEEIPGASLWGLAVFSIVVTFLIFGAKSADFAKHMMTGTSKGGDAG